MKRIRDEDGSRFNNFQILNHRYALLNLLGKGGFSEVYKAFDLVEHRYVACKLHGLNAQWSEEKKQSYIRHAIREYNIHKTLVHHHIVRLWDIFEIDHNTFCTVLEYCSGKDLDAVLKATPILPEMEARVILVQVFQGLVYMNKRAQKIIHYDLNPGNVLFDELGGTKVTDFGLSKIVEDNVGSQGMELTSQGAGTYWYFPPECFELSKTPLISSKVDVWSAGVLFYQMLFGRHPFGHDQTQERILHEDTIIKARKVEFPSRPSVSNEAKELIRRCLTYNQSERPNVLTIAQDPYLTYSKRARDHATDYEACSKLEDLNIDVRKNSKETEERFLTDNFSQRQEQSTIPLHEVIFSTIDKPKLLSQPEVIPPLPIVIVGYEMILSIHMMELMVRVECLEDEEIEKDEEHIEGASNSEDNALNIRFNDTDNDEGDECYFDNVDVAAAPPG
ncbi:hypothetical protein RIF29_30073 [Crotalaria pallida]|uniref:Protein kinase domain-containing protein n=1 Tax=Crotalaria pallida TaxID=3830 RepID=A0AAN9EFN9_CROPI